ncbi:MAG: TerC family protein [candidate division Zixibacteria bacterium]|nr:TerC family protein [candidate division Zixibacteria bacterium]
MEAYLQNQTLLYGAFILFVLGMLALDLGIFHRRDHVVSVRESLIWTAVWIVLALAFMAFVYYRYETISPGRGTGAALEFLTGYLIEKSLSIDNVFVFLLIFSYFNVAAQYQHRVLFWGIIGALIFRAIFIALGALLIAKFHAIIYLFGGFLVFTGIKMAWAKDKQIHPERNPILRLFQKMVAVTADYRGKHFFVREGGKWLATPLFVVLILVESSDIIFAVDSIPAIFAVTKDPYIVFTANVFAILGLRSLYFALAGVMKLFHHLHYGLSIILVFVGVKMVLSDLYKIPIGISLGVVGLIIAGSIVASLIWPRKETAPVKSTFDSGHKT